MNKHIYLLCDENHKDFEKFLDTIRDNICGCIRIVSISENKEQIISELQEEE